MEANELRIGNLIYWNIPEKQNITHNVVGIFKGKPQTIPISLGDTIRDYSPIPLTEEWLINFGYEKDEDQFLSGYLDFTKGNEYIRINDNSTFYRDGNVCIGNKKNLIYVHQLQNLYFALTGEELKLQS